MNMIKHTKMTTPLKLNYIYVTYATNIYSHSHYLVVFIYACTILVVCVFSLLAMSLILAQIWYYLAYTNYHD